MENFEAESRKVEYGIVDMSNELTPEEMAPEGVVVDENVGTFVFDAPVVSCHETVRQNSIF